MRVVLYTDQMEPITVCDLSTFAEEHLEKHGRVRLAVIGPVQTTPCNEPPMNIDFKYVTIWMERFVRAGRKHSLLFTHDDENTLLLRAAFLPGQQRALNDIQSQAIIDGFLRAISLLGRKI